MSNSEKRIALVTGANRGLGLETVRQLQQNGIEVWLSARNQNEGMLAANKVNASFVSIDVTSHDSIADAVDQVRDLNGRLDILINNAGITMDGFNGRVARGTIATNLEGAISVTDAFLPIMPDGATIVMISSGMGTLDAFSKELKRRFIDPTISRNDLHSLMDEFIAAVDDSSYAKKGWPGAAYTVSKAGLNAFVRMLSRDLEKRSIIVNAVSPGWVRTDMGGAGAPRSLEEGANGITRAALLHGSGAAGGSFLQDGETISW